MSSTRYKVQIQGGKINSVKSLRILRTIYSLSLNAAIQLAMSVEKEREFVLVEGVTETFALALKQDLETASVDCQIKPCDKKSACLCVPINNQRKRWNALRLLVTK